MGGYLELRLDDRRHDYLASNVCLYNDGWDNVKFDKPGDSLTQKFVLACAFNTEVPRCQNQIHGQVPLPLHGREHECRQQGICRWLRVQKNPGVEDASVCEWHQGRVDCGEGGIKFMLPLMRMHAVVCTDRVPHCMSSWSARLGEFK